MLIPWSEVLTIVVSEQFSPAIRQEARRIGFTGETSGIDACLRQVEAASYILLVGLFLNWIQISGLTYC
jgi:hypothetical protein